MKTKIVFKVEVLEMIFIILITFFAGIIVSGDGESKFVFTGLLLLSAGILLLKKRVKVLTKEK